MEEVGFRDLFFYVPEGFAAVFGETIQGADFGEATEFGFVERDAFFEIVHGGERSEIALGENFLGVLGAKPLNDAEAETNGIILFNCAEPIRAHGADRAKAEPPAAAIFDNRRGGVKAHRLVVQEANVKFGSAM